MVLDAPGSKPGYLARLLINEAPFPGEHGYVSVQDTKMAMTQILWVLDSRVNHIPQGYHQAQIAAVQTSDVFDIITAGGERGQCDGFYRDPSGALRMVPRTEERVAYLLQIANGGGRPGKFAELLNYAQNLARTYLASGMNEADIFAGISRVGNLSVTGRGYSWMTDRDYYSPGGNYIKISNEQKGSLGGNRFFTLRIIP